MNRRNLSEDADRNARRMFENDVGLKFTEVVEYRINKCNQLVLKNDVLRFSIEET